MKKPKAKRLAEEIHALEAELHTRQRRCQHPERHRTYRLEASTGNYDPTHDCYWTEYHCARCLKSWDQDDQRNLVGRRIK